MEKSSKKIETASFYFDSAYVAKYYINEPEPPRVRQLVSAADAMYSSAWCRPEMACVLHRQVREGRLKWHEADKLRQLFSDDVASSLWQLVPVTEILLRQLEAATRILPRSVFLRAGDAVHLISARDSGFSEIWSNDRHLLAAAPHFGLRGRSI